MLSKAVAEYSCTLTTRKFLPPAAVFAAAFDAINAGYADNTGRRTPPGSDLRPPVIGGAWQPEALSELELWTRDASKSSCFSTPRSSVPLPAARSRLICRGMAAPVACRMPVAWPPRP